MCIKRLRSSGGSFSLALALILFGLSHSLLSAQTAVKECGCFRITRVDLPKRLFYFAYDPNLENSLVRRAITRLAPTKDGGAYLGWTDSDRDYSIARLDSNDKLTGGIFTVRERELLALCADSTGFATANVKGDRLYVSKYDRKNNLIFEHQLTGFKSKKEYASRFFYNPPSAQIAWSGKMYAVIFGHNSHHLDDVNHQGDFLAFFDAAGNRIKGGWTWGVSHSLGQQLIFDGKEFVVTARGDASPRGLAYSRVSPDVQTFSKDGWVWAVKTKTVLKNIYPIRRGAGKKLYQWVPLVLGGLTHDGTDTIITLSADQSERKPPDYIHDPIFLKVNEKAEVVHQKLLLTTPELSEENVKIARLGSRYLIAWKSYPNRLGRGWEKKIRYHFFAEIDGEGNILFGPWGDIWYPILGFDEIDDFSNFANGDVGWAQGYSDARSIYLFRYFAPENRPNKPALPIHAAARSGLLDVIRAYLEEGYDVAERTAQGEWTALHIAAENGHLDIAKALLDAGVDVNIKNWSGWTPLLNASAEGQEPVVAELLKRGAEIHWRNRYGNTALLLAAWKGHEETLKLLVRAGCDVNARDQWGKTALHHAAEQNLPSMAKMLLESKARVNPRTQEGWTPLHFAAKHDSAPLVRVLMDHGASATALTEDGEIPFDIARKGKNTAILDQLRTKKAGR
jgi:ankyrin repeat protein